MPTALQRHVYLPWTPGVQPSWTVSGVSGALGEHERGSFANSAKLVDAMFRDDRLAAVVNTRLNALFGLPFALDPADESDAAIAAAEEATEDWPSWCPEAVLREAKRWQLFMGFAILQIIWERTAKRYTPTLKVWHPQFIYADEDRGVLVAETQSGPVDIPIGGGDAKWVVLGTTDRPWMNGLVRPLAVPWLVAQWGLRDWARYSERHGMPIVKAMVPVVADDVDKDDFFEDVRTLSVETTVQLPVGIPGANGDPLNFDLDLVEATDDSWKGFQGLLSHVHDTYSIALTGNNLTTLIEGGSFAAAKTAEGILGQYVAADAEELSTELHNQKLVPWAEFNFAQGAAVAPWPKWDTSPPEDLKLKAETFGLFGKALTELKNGGAKPRDLVAMAEMFGLDVDEEEPPPPPPSPFDQMLPPDSGEDDAPEAMRRNVRLASGDDPTAAKGFIQGQLYADHLADKGQRQSAALLPLEALARIIETSTGYDDLRVRMRAAFADMDPEPFAEVMEKALILSDIAGRWAAVQDEPKPSEA